MIRRLSSDLRAGPLGQRQFRLLFLGRTTSFIGSAFANVALAFAVLDLTGSKADLGYVLAARSIPQVVFLLVGGIWADRLPRHLVMVTSNIVSGAQPGRDRGPPAHRPRPGLAPDGPRRAQRRELGVLLPGRVGDRPADRPEADAPERERDPPPRLERELDRRRRARRAGRRGDEPRRRASPPTRPRSSLAALFTALIRLPRELRMEAVELLRRARRRLAGVQLAHVAVGDRRSSSAS